MSERSAERYGISEFLKKGYDRSEIRAELQFGEAAVQAGIVDISVKGICVELSSADRPPAGDPDSGGSIFIKIVLRDTAIMVNGRIAWSAVAKKGGENVVKAGLEFTVISPEDSLALSEIIGAVRRV
jgi:hypothetical protein